MTAKAIAAGPGQRDARDARRASKTRPNMHWLRPSDDERQGGCSRPDAGQREEDCRRQVTQHQPREADGHHDHRPCTEGRHGQEEDDASVRQPNGEGRGCEHDGKGSHRQGEHRPERVARRAGPATHDEQRLDPPAREVYWPTYRPRAGRARGPIGFDYAARMTTDTRVAVIGLGYVGLPLAIAFAEAGLEVEGIDVSAARVATLAAGRSPIDDVTDERLGAALDAAVPRRRPRPTRSSTMPTRSSSACRRRSPPRRTPTSGRCSRRRLHPRPPPRRPARRAPVHDLPGHDGRALPRGHRGRRAARRRRLRPGLRPGAGEPGRPGQRRPRRAAPRRRA